MLQVVVSFLISTVEKVVENHQFIMNFLRQPQAASGRAYLNPSWQVPAELTVSTTAAPQIKPEKVGEKLGRHIVINALQFQGLNGNCLKHQGDNRVVSARRSLGIKKGVRAPGNHKNLYLSFPFGGISCDCPTAKSIYQLNSIDMKNLCLDICLKNWSVSTRHQRLSSWLWAIWYDG